MANSRDLSCGVGNQIPRALQILGERGRRLAQPVDHGFRNAVDAGQLLLHSLELIGGVRYVCICGAGVAAVAIADGVTEPLGELAGNFVRSPEELVAVWCLGLGFEHRNDVSNQVLVNKGLHQEVRGAQIERSQQVGFLTQTAVHENSRRTVDLEDLPHRRQAIEHRHLEVQDEQVRSVLLVALDSLSACRGLCDDLELVLRQPGRDSIPHLDRVVCNHDPSLRRTNVRPPRDTTAVSWCRGEV